MPFCSKCGVEMGAYKNRRLRVNGSKVLRTTNHAHDRM